MKASRASVLGRYRVHAQLLSGWIAQTSLHSGQTPVHMPPSVSARLKCAATRRPLISGYFVRPGQVTQGGPSGMGSVSCSWVFPPTDGGGI